MHRDIFHKHEEFIQREGMSLGICIQSGQLFLNAGIVGGEHAQRHDPVILKEKAAVVIIMYGGIAAQSKGVYIKALYKGLPVPDLDPVVCTQGFPAFNDGNIGSRTPISTMTAFSSETRC